ncbi:hypothetical protein KC887_02715 [Candidatus Kaiserbacteria bacterium]|nr:hypothetical protein [Candidatus Kaiserbacteria bacterium]
MRNEADVIEMRIVGLTEVDGLERPLAEKLVHWGIYTLGDFFRRPSLYLAEIVLDDWGEGE